MKFFCLTRKIFLALCAAAFFCAPFFAEITFSSVNLNDNDEVLFSLGHKISGSTEYSTVFKGRIKDGKAEYFPRAVTCFPERMTVFGGVLILSGVWETRWRIPENRQRWIRQSCV